MREDYGSVLQEIKEEISHLVREEIHYQLCEKILIGILCLIVGSVFMRIGYLLYESLS